MPVRSESAEIDLIAVARAAAAERAPGEDVDGALKRVCASLYPDDPERSLHAVTLALDALAHRGRTDRETVLRRATEEGFSSMVSGPIRVSRVTMTSSSGSLEDLPPEVRGRVREMLASGNTKATVVVEGGISSMRVPASLAPGAGRLRPCVRCGYAPDVELSTCPQCGLPVKRSWWARLFGR